jgi:hypothetical protein
MRSLFAILVLGNVVLAGWYALRPAPPAAASSRMLGVPTIELVGERLNDAHRVASSWADNGAWERRDVATARGERSAAASTATVLEPSSPGAAAPSPSCISIGPFRDDAAAEQAAASLAAAGHALSKRSAEEDFWIGYWVYIEKLESAAQARDVAARMRDGGIDDAYVVSDEDLGTLVSLGVFSGERRANRQRDTARSLGSEPTVVERTRRAVATWLDVTGAGAPSIDLQTLQPAESSAPLRQESCADPISP